MINTEPHCYGSSRRLGRRNGPTIIFSIFLAANIFLLSGCLDILWDMPVKQDIEGVQLLHPGGMSAVDSLQPEFRWNGAAGSSYDFAIWKLREKPYRMTMFSCGDAFARGNLGVLRTVTPFYYVENLKENVYRIATPLEPANCYAWSVRLRTGNVPGEWSTVTASNWLGEIKFNQKFELFRTLPAN